VSVGVRATQGTCLSSESVLSTKVQAQVQAIASSTRVQSLNMTNLFCDDDLCPAVINGLIPTWDGKHLTRSIRRIWPRRSNRRSTCGDECGAFRTADHDEQIKSSGAHAGITNLLNSPREFFIFTAF